MSNFLHQWLTVTQYIAPLMANFDTTVGNNSKIHYVDNREYFILLVISQLLELVKMGKSLTNPLLTLSSSPFTGQGVSHMQLEVLSTQLAQLLVLFLWDTRLWSQNDTKKTLGYIISGNIGV